MMGRPSRGAVRGRSNLGLGVRVQREYLGGAELAVAVDVVLLDKGVAGRGVVPRREHLSLSHVPVGVGVVAASASGRRRLRLSGAWTGGRTA